MEYFLIETGEGNRVPYNINKNRAIDIRFLTREGIRRFPRWNVMEMNFPMEGFFPDLLCSPCIMVSRCFMETTLMYHAGTPYIGAKLWDKESGSSATYFLPIFEEIECLSDKCQYNSIGNRMTELVLAKDKINAFAAFRIKDFKRNCIVGRLDFVESLLRRGIQGIKLTEVGMVDVEQA
ncbi:hypothetical protein IMSAGC005_02324 [Lachnospiraceae bacterium]|nr:hypothetical protein IMSAGC005_02324 [Lachnospiraceae bacterium]